MTGLPRVDPLAHAGAVRPATTADADAIARIYNHYVAHSIVTFEEEAVSVDDMAGRIGQVLAEGLPWLVGEEGGRVVGYAYASKWKRRYGYRFSVESTVYLDPGCMGRGWGTRLYEGLFPLLSDWGAHLVIGGIALPNDASVALHEKVGMEKVAHFREVGIKFGQWIDVGYWQLTLSRAGVEGRG